MNLETSSGRRLLTTGSPPNKRAQSNDGNSRRNRRSSNKGSKSRRPTQLSQKLSATRGKGGLEKTIEEFAILSDTEDTTQTPDMENPGFLKQLSLYGNFNSYKTSESEDEAILALLNLSMGDLMEVDAKCLPTCCLHKVSEDTDKSTQGFEVVQVIGLGLRLKEMM